MYYDEINIKKEPEDSDNYVEKSLTNFDKEGYHSFDQVTKPDLGRFESLVSLENKGVTDAIVSRDFIKKHTFNDKCFKCNYCTFSCDTAKHLAQHTKFHLSGKLYNCEICDYETDILKNFEEHIRKNINKQYECDLCQYSFHKPSELKNHVIIMHTDFKPFKCNYCEYTCKLQKILNQNLRKHKEKKISCKYCDFLCFQNSDLVTHIFYKHREHCTANTFKCNECGKEFIKQRELRIHHATHTKQYFNHCSECDYSCSRKDILELHIKKFHTRQEKEVKCPKCDFKCFNHTQLNRHSVVHTNMRFFSCDLCDYVCRKKVTLQEHCLKKHNVTCIIAELRAKCDKCEYVAVDKRELLRHSVIHTGDKFIKCDKCHYVCRGKKTLQKHRFKEHITKDSTSKMKCNQCEYVAINIRDIKRHSVLHSGNNIFKCELCHYVCRQNKTLKVHKLKHHGNDKKIQLQPSDISISGFPLELNNFKKNAEKAQMSTSIMTNSVISMQKFESNEDILNESTIDILRDVKKNICEKTTSVRMSNEYLYGVKAIPLLKEIKVECL